MRWQLLACGSLVFFNACNWGVDCVSVARAGIVVEVSDSVTGVPITRGYTVIVAEGVYRETIVSPPEGPAAYPAAAYERAGTYTVTVEANGYAEWRRTGVRVVEEGDCRHVRTVTVVARLQRQ